MVRRIFTGIESKDIRQDIKEEIKEEKKEQDVKEKQDILIVQRCVPIEEMFNYIASKLEEIISLLQNK